MVNSQKKQSVSVKGTGEHRSPEQLRKIGRALIALARAQLETEAEAAHQRQEQAAAPTSSKQGRPR